MDHVFEDGAEARAADARLAERASTCQFWRRGGRAPHRRWRLRPGLLGIAMVRLALEDVDGALGHPPRRRDYVEIRLIGLLRIAQIGHSTRLFTFGYLTSRWRRRRDCRARA